MTIKFWKKVSEPIDRLFILDKTVYTEKMYIHLIYQMMKNIFVLDHIPII